MTDYVMAQGGKQLPISDLAKEITYDTNNNVSTIKVIYSDVTYIQTYTYVGNNLTNISQFIPQV